MDESSLSFKALLIWMSPPSRRIDAPSCDTIRLMSTTILDRDIIDRLPGNSTLILRNVSWDEYEALLAAVGEAPGLRISYDEGTLQIRRFHPRMKASAASLKDLSTA